jgi:hypothetical protein
MNKAIAIFLFLVLLAGCRSMPFHRSNPKTKTVTTGRGGKMMRASIDSELAREKRGERPSAGKKTWREYWEWRISLWRRDKHKQYEQYLIRRRKEVGLKDVRRL